MNISHLSRRVVGPVISSLDRLSITGYWLLIVGYISIAAITIQFLVLPVFLKDYHWGGGFLDIRDAITYHTVSKEVANRINDHGLSEWSLKPRSNRDDLRIKSGISGIVSIIYAYSVPELWTIIPFNAVVHATTALVLLNIFLLLGMNKSWAMFATLPFVFYPSSAQWWSQIGKDGVLILGIFLVFYSFLLGIRSSRWGQFAFAFLYAVLGFFMIWLMREYMLILFSLFSIFALAVYVAHSVWINDAFNKLFSVSYVGLLCCLIVFFNNTGFIVEQKSASSVVKSEQTGKISKSIGINSEKLTVDSFDLKIENGQILGRDGTKVRVSGVLKIENVENGNILLKKSSELPKTKEHDESRAKVDDTVLQSIIDQMGKDGASDAGDVLHVLDEGMSEDNVNIALKEDDLVLKMGSHMSVISAQDYNKLQSDKKRFEIRDYLPVVVLPYYDRITLISNNLYQRFSSKSDSLITTLGYKVSASINGVRKNFDGDYRTASSVDETVRFYNMSDLINYLPRALQIGLFAPFPDQWLKPGSSEPNTIMRKIAIFEMSFFYVSLVFLLLNIKWVLRSPGVLYMLLISISVIIFYSYFMSNIGTLYRMRFGFHILICAISVGAFLKYMLPDNGSKSFTEPLVQN